MKSRKLDTRGWFVNLYVLKIAQEDTSRDFLSLRCLMVNDHDETIPVIWSIQGFQPYVYYREIAGKTMSTEYLIREWTSNGIIVTHWEIVSGRPLNGYQRDACLYYKIYLDTEASRKRLINMRVPNLHEVEISLIERFSADSGIVPGSLIVLDVFKIQKRGLGFTHLNTIRSKTFVRDVVCYTSTMSAIVGVRNTDRIFRGAEPKAAVVSFRYVYARNESVLRGEIPIARVTKNMRKEKFRDDLRETPIHSIVIIIKNCGVEYGEVYETTRIVLTTRESTREISVVDGTTIRSFYKKKARDGLRHRKGEDVERGERSEMQMIVNFLNILSRCDIIVGFKLQDSYGSHSLGYAFNRLLSLGKSDVFLGNMRLINIDWGVLRKRMRCYKKEKGEGVYPREFKNPFPYTSSIDLMHYVISSMDKRVPTSSFTAAFNCIMHPLSAGEWSSVGVYQEGRNLLYETAATYCENVFSLMDHECIIQKTMTRTSNFGLPIDIIWTSGQARIIRLSLLRELAIMRREGTLYVISSTQNAYNNRKTRFKGMKGECGGSVLKTTGKYIPVSGFTVDYNAHYPNIIIGSQLDFVNVIVNPEKGEVPEDIPHVIATIGNRMKVVFIQREDEKELPLVRVFIRLKRQRAEIKRKRKSDANMDMADTRYAADESAIKLLMVSITGAIRCTYDFIFKYYIIADVMAYIGRNLMREAMDRVQDRTFLFYDKEREVPWVFSPSKLENRVSLQFSVVGGSTDGFDVVVRGAGGPGYIDLGCENAGEVGRLMAEHIQNKWISHLSTGLQHVNTGNRNVYRPGMKLEKVFRKVLYVATNKTICLREDGTVSTKGTYDKMLMFCRLSREIYFKAVGQILLNDEPYMNTSAWLSKFDREVERMSIEEKVSALSLYARVGKSRHESKFNGKMMNVVVSAIREAQRSLRVEIPSVQQHMQLVWIVGGKATHANVFNEEVDRLDMVKYKEELTKKLEDLYETVNYTQLTPSI